MTKSTGPVDPAPATMGQGRTRYYDPATDAWSKGPRVPKPRTMAAGVRLDDEFVLVVVGYADRYWSDPLPLRSAIRFEPER